VFRYVFMCLREKVIPEMACTASSETSNPTTHWSTYPDILHVWFGWSTVDY